MGTAQQLEGRDREDPIHAEVDAGGVGEEGEEPEKRRAERQGHPVAGAAPAAQPEAQGDPREQKPEDLVHPHRLAAGPEAGERREPQGPPGRGDEGNGRRRDAGESRKRYEAGPEAGL